MLIPIAEPKSLHAQNQSAALELMPVEKLILNPSQSVTENALLIE
jgi:hypothetical protein